MGFFGVSLYTYILNHKLKFAELGPCRVTPELETILNPYSWNEISNLLFISQPLNVGFSYVDTPPYSNPSAGNNSQGPKTTTTDEYTTDDAAIASWHILQGFYDALPQLDGRVKSKVFNLWTKSYGGHYGPSFYNYFHEENQKLRNGVCNGTELIFNTLGIGNGIIDLYTQAPYYPMFAVNNTYAVKAVNDSVYDAMTESCWEPGGCLDLISNCAHSDTSKEAGIQSCVQAANDCRLNVEEPYYMYSGRSAYDIRVPAPSDSENVDFEDYLNLVKIQNALGVERSYTLFNWNVYYAFGNTGDLAYPDFLADLGMLLDNSVRIILYHGDADYICNWFGGEAVSLNISYCNSDGFRKAEYAPLIYEGIEYGEVRHWANLTFIRIYDAGHHVPYYQPKISLEMFTRALNHVDIATGISNNDNTHSYHNKTLRSKATHTGRRLSGRVTAKDQIIGQTSWSPGSSTQQIKARGTISIPNFGSLRV